MKKSSLFKSLLLSFLLIGGFSGLFGQVISSPTEVALLAPVKMTYPVSGSLTKRAILQVQTTAKYASISLFAGEKLVLDNLDIPFAGSYTLNGLVSFEQAGDVELTLQSNGGTVTVNSLGFEDVTSVGIPQHKDVTTEIGISDSPSLKYGGPTIADVNNDGLYDLVLNNHNDASSQLFWNAGDGTFTKHEKELALWKQMDLHGTSAGDYDNDGDLDLLLTIGGGNGTSPTPPVLYKNENGNFIRSAADVGITSGARGRGARWADYDLDGDLDLALFNAEGINGAGDAQHIFYVNKGDGTFSLINVAGLENAKGERVLLTDLNNDHIDDVVFMAPLSVWKGNGDYTFTDMTTQWLPANLANKWGAMAAADVDIDNDGDLDLYLACGSGYFAIANNNSVDFVPENKNLDMRLSGSKGIVAFELEAEGALDLYEFSTTYRSTYDGDLPIYLGSAMEKHLIASLDENLPLTQEGAAGFPETRTENGIYIGHVGDGKWKVELVKNGDLFWNISFSIQGAHIFNADWDPFNRNVQDILLLNNGDSFVDVSTEWNIPQGGNHWGVTTGDFNNDSHQDLYIHRYGFMKNRIADYMLLNNGKGGFEITTDHTAKTTGTKCHADMGQAFDYDLDGDVDIFNGDDELGVWYMYSNTKVDNNNYAIVKVGYSPLENVDPISAEITVQTASGNQYKRVESAGENFSQCLLNMVHFGLGQDETVEKITVRWRNGEVAEFTNKAANQVFDTDKVDPVKVTVTPATEEVRVGTSIELDVVMEPVFANRSVKWSSSDETIASVDENTGVVTGIKAGQSVTITATSDANGLIGTATVTVIEFYAIAVASVNIVQESLEVIEGNIISLKTEVLPKYADDKSLSWSSNNEAVATVDENGMVTTLSDGTAIITAVSKVNAELKDQVEVKVIKLVAPSIKFVTTGLTSKEFVSGENLELTVNVEAGTGNTIAVGSTGGVKFFFRHLTKSWGVIKDLVAVDASLVGEQSGIASVSIPLTDVTPTAELTNGEFYFVYIVFTSTNGEEYNVTAQPIKVVKGSADISTFESTENSLNLSVQPNPVDNTLFLSGKESDRFQVQIYDLTGTEQLKTFISGNESVNVSDLASGMYAILITSQKGQEALKFVKK